MLRYNRVTNKIFVQYHGYLNAFPQHYDQHLFPCSTKYLTESELNQEQKDVMVMTKRNLDRVHQELHQGFEGCEEKVKVNQNFYFKFALKRYAYFSSHGNNWHLWQALHCLNIKPREVYEAMDGSELCNFQYFPRGIFFPENFQNNAGSAKWFVYSQYKKPGFAYRLGKLFKKKSIVFLY